jgi:proline iminopeptidase
LRFIFLRFIAFLPPLLFSLNGAAQSEGWAICNSGANLYFKIIGSGPPLVLIGDSGHSSKYMLDLANGLSANYRVVYFDPRSTGKSKAKWVNDSLVNFQRTVADIEGLRLVLRIPSWAVVAHAFGSNVALAYAARFPRGVSNLVLINPEIATSTHHVNFAEYEFPTTLQPSEITSKFEILKQKISTQNPADSLARWKAIAAFQATSYSIDTLNASFLEDYITESFSNMKLNEQIKNQYQKKYLQFNANLNNLYKPVTVFVSRKKQDYQQIIRSFKNIKPDCKTVSIDNAHHFPWLDNPGVFYTNIRNSIGTEQNLPNLVYKQQNESEKKNHRTDRGGHQRRKRA